jgi:glycosyltransferase involved in cell wall biosynthesis
MDRRSQPPAAAGRVTTARKSERYGHRPPLQLHPEPTGGTAPECPGLSIVVPVLNGAPTVGALVEALVHIEVAGGLEIVLINDGSTDDSLAASRAAAMRAATRRVPVTVVDLARNFGEHNAVMAGLHYARGEYVITMDDDLQNPPAEVGRLLAHARDHALDVVYTYSAQREHAWWRNAGSAFTGWCSDRLLDKPRGLYLSSFRCISRRAVREVIAHQGPYPYIDGLLLQATQNVGRLSVAHAPRAAGRSNYTLRRLVRLWLSTFLNFSIAPLRLSTVVGLLAASAGGIALMAVVIEGMRGGPPRGWASLMAIVLLMGGVQLTMLGIIGEYLGRLYLTVNGKPQFVVRDSYPPPQ